jgi:hypothetical protein
LSPVCPGIKRSGGRCTVGAKPGETWCYNHDPARAEERRRAASRAGKSKPSREIVGIKTMLRDLAERVLAGEVETGRAAVAQLRAKVAPDQERKLADARRAHEEAQELREKAYYRRRGVDDAYGLYAQGTYGTPSS